MIAVMKKLLYSMFSLMAFASCGPTAYMLPVEARTDSRTSVYVNENSAVLLDNRAIAFDSLAAVSIAQGISEKIEAQFGMEPMTVPVYRGFHMSDSLAEEFAPYDYLFVIDSIGDGTVEVREQDMRFGEELQYNNIVSDLDIFYRVYDVRSSKVLHSSEREGISYGIYTEPGLTVREVFDGIVLTQEKLYRAFGEHIASSCMYGWVTKGRMLYVYENDSRWVEAFRYASEFKWDKAIEIWLSYVGNKGHDRRTSAAAYNLSVAFEVIGKTDLAEDWLDYSDSLVKMTYSDYQRQIVE